MPAVATSPLGILEAVLAAGDLRRVVAVVKGLRGHDSSTQAVPTFATRPLGGSAAVVDLLSALAAVFPGAAAALLALLRKQIQLTIGTAPAALLDTDADRLVQACVQLGASDYFRACCLTASPRLLGARHLLLLGVPRSLAAGKPMLGLLSRAELNELALLAYPAAALLDSPGTHIRKGGDGSNRGSVAAVCVCGIDLTVRRPQPAAEQGSRATAAELLVLTASTQHNLRRVATALAFSSRGPPGGYPILLEGPSGSGKTSSIRYLATHTGYERDLIELHLDDIMDSRALLGGYVCTDIPGEFQWQAGPVTQALLSGRWIVIEDIDRAPFEVLAALSSIFTEGRLYIPGRSEPVLARPGFQLFATRCTPSSTSTTAAASSWGGALAGSSAAEQAAQTGWHGRFSEATTPQDSVPVGFSGSMAAFLHSWLRVPILPLGSLSPPRSGAAGQPTGPAPIAMDSLDGELAQVLRTLHPSLPPAVLGAMMATYDLLALAHEPAARGGGSSSAAARSRPPSAASASVGSQNSSALQRILPPEVRDIGQFGRRLSPRDMFSWAQRIRGLTAVDALCSSSSGSGGGASFSAPAEDVFIPDREKEAIVMEALSAFAGHVPDPKLRLALARPICIIWGLGEDAAERLFALRKPDVALTGAPSQGDGGASLRIGRVTLPLAPAARDSGSGGSSSAAAGDSILPRGFAPTRHGLTLLERIAACVALAQPALLVGETGIGKTTGVQVLARMLGAKLTVINLNMQSDSGDLLGGFKPAALKQIAGPLLGTFLDLFARTFSEAANAPFLAAVSAAAAGAQWAKLSRGLSKAVQMAGVRLGGPAQQQRSGGDLPSADLQEAWAQFTAQLAAFERQRLALAGAAEPAAAASPSGGAPTSSPSSSASSSAFAFTFVEGALVTAVRQGHWVLLDEINLATPETLQRLSGLLEGGLSSRLTLTERGATDSIAPHPSFRLFGAMNPATDAGKRNLPSALRLRFTEIYVEDVLDREDLRAIVHGCLAHLGGSMTEGATLERVVSFYLEARALSAPRTGSLRDGGGGRPHYSVRSLTRGLRIASDLVTTGGFPPETALQEGLAMSFLVQLDVKSGALLAAVAANHLGSGAGEPAPAGSGGSGGAPPAAKKPKQKQPWSKVAVGAGGPAGMAEGGSSGAPSPLAVRGAARDPALFVRVRGYWLRRGPLPPVDHAVAPSAPAPGGPSSSASSPRYVLVPSVARHIHNLSRAVMCGRFPVLLQGPTSSGKTSMVEYLAALTGNVCIRLNNHEHTDLAEYTGSYVTHPSTGRLVFTDGLLVTALRHGYWLILDELNLAPTEVLEALNRLLDDNRELFVPETQEVIRPHPHFMLFATQNPAGLYGGRKQLSLAFRNRFLELFIDDIPERELETILGARSSLPASFVTCIVGVMSDLHRLRQSSDVFAGKHGFVTTRDLLRWASRRPDDYAVLAECGFMLLAERLRSEEEKAVVRGVIVKHCRAPEFDAGALYEACCPVGDIAEWAAERVYRDCGFTAEEAADPAQSTLTVEPLGAGDGGSAPGGSLKRPLLGGSSQGGSSSGGGTSKPPSTKRARRDAAAKAAASRTAPPDAALGSGAANGGSSSSAAHGAALSPNYADWSADAFTSITRRRMRRLVRGLIGAGGGPSSGGSGGGGGDFSTSSSSSRDATSLRDSGSAAAMDCDLGAAGDTGRGSSSSAGSTRGAASSPAPPPPSSTTTAAVYSLDDEEGEEDDLGEGEQEGLRDPLPSSALRTGSVPGTEGLSTISVTRSLQRLFTLVTRCIANDEPVLLVGDTGCGKTTVIQVFALLLQRPLHVVNCQAHTETADFLGSLRPVRNKAALSAAFARSVAAYADAVRAAAAVAPAAAAGVEEEAAGEGGAPATASSGEALLLDRRAAELSSLARDASKGDDAAATFSRLESFHATELLLLRASRHRQQVPLSDTASAAVAASSHGIAAVEAAFEAAAAAARASAAIFEWCDGPLVTAMQAGDFFLLDEASLAEDAVLERLNSVLEPSRTLTLAEKGDSSSSGGGAGTAAQADSAAPPAAPTAAAASSLVVKAAKGFRFFATMNPGGDFGKRELSPALRNRFTEVWVPPITSSEDLLVILRDKAASIALHQAVRPAPVGGVPRAHALVSLFQFVAPMVRFVRWFDAHASSGRLVRAGPSATAAAAEAAAAHTPRSRVLLITLRDIHAWLTFMGAVLHPGGSRAAAAASIHPWAAYAHGACLILLDGLGLGAGVPPAACAEIVAAARDFIEAQAPVPLRPEVRAALMTEAVVTSEARVVRGQFGLAPFFIPHGAPLPPAAASDDDGQLATAVVSSSHLQFSLRAPTTRRNLFRILRAMQLPKPVLLEGSPGVGKSSLIEALADASGHALVRINLSEQTDLGDLFGQDVPSTGSSAADGGEGGSGASGFAWADGAFLKAIKSGAWVLLDELNLASQSVLEGLNSCLDHRGTVFIPELGASFACPPSFRVFAAQNPVGQGGGRKGLPKSFLNRFTKVTVDELGREDQYTIAAARYPALAACTQPAPSPDAAGTASSPAAAAPSLLASMIEFNNAIRRDTSSPSPPSAAAAAASPSSPDAAAAASQMLYGREGHPWEFNLRDLFRWCDLVSQQLSLPPAAAAAAHEGAAASVASLCGALGVPAPPSANPTVGLATVFLARFRTGADRAAACLRFASIFCGGQQGDSPASTAMVMRMLVEHLHAALFLRVSPASIVLDDVAIGRALIPGLWSQCPTDGLELGAAQVDALCQQGSAGAALLPLAVALPPSPRVPFRHALVAAAPVVSHGAVADASASDTAPPPPASTTGTGSLALLRSQTRSLYHLGACVAQEWPCLLVGGVGVGKRSTVRTLASLAGAALREVSVTPATDATELLGCFEQADVLRHVVELQGALGTLVRGVAATATALHSQLEDPIKSGGGAAVQRLLAAADAAAALSGRFAADGAAGATYISAVEAVLSQCAEVGCACVAQGGALSELQRLLQHRLDAALQRLRHDLRRLAAHTATTAAAGAASGSTGTRGQFEWVDGVLVQALQRGEWLLLRNVNFCSPAVIDRLNTLLEPGGALLLSEAGIDAATGMPRVVHRHSGFRVFFTMNPAYGPVSRALRNRCVEVFVDALDPGAGQAAPSASAAASLPPVVQAVLASLPSASPAAEVAAAGPSPPQSHPWLQTASLLTAALTRTDPAVAAADGAALIRSCGAFPAWLADSMWAAHASALEQAAVPSARIKGLTPPSLAHLRRWSEVAAQALLQGQTDLLSAAPASDGSNPSQQQHRFVMELVCLTFRRVYWGCILPESVAPLAEQLWAHLGSQSEQQQQQQQLLLVPGAAPQPLGATASVSSSPIAPFDIVVQGSQQLLARGLDTSFCGSSLAASVAADFAALAPLARALQAAALHLEGAPAPAHLAARALHPRDLASVWYRSELVALRARLDGADAGLRSGLLSSLLLQAAAAQPPAPHDGGGRLVLECAAAHCSAMLALLQTGGPLLLQQLAVAGPPSPLLPTLPAHPALAPSLLLRCCADGSPAPSPAVQPHSSRLLTLLAVLRMRMDAAGHAATLQCFSDAVAASFSEALAAQQQRQAAGQGHQGALRSAAFPCALLALVALGSRVAVQPAIASLPRARVIEALPHPALVPITGVVLQVRGLLSALHIRIPQLPGGAAGAALLAAAHITALQQGLFWAMLNLRSTVHLSNGTATWEAPAAPLPLQRRSSPLPGSPSHASAAEATGPWDSIVVTFRALLKALLSHRDALSAGLAGLPDALQLLESTVHFAAHADLLLSGELGGDGAEPLGAAAPEGRSSAPAMMLEPLSQPYSSSSSANQLGDLALQQSSRVASLLRLLVRSRPKHTLWKQGGHPALPGSLQASDALEEVKRLSCAVAGRDAAADAALFPTYQQKRVLLDGWGSVVWAVGAAAAQGGRPMAVVSAPAPLTDRVAAVLTALRREFPASLWCPSPPLALEEASSSSSAAAAASDDDMEDSVPGANAEVNGVPAALLESIGLSESAVLLRRRAARLRTRRLVCLWALAEERGLQAIIIPAYAAASIAGGDATDGPSSASPPLQDALRASARRLRDCAAPLRSWLAVAVAGTGWGALDLQPYLSLLWALDAAPQGNDGALLANAVRVLHTAVDTMQLSWYRRVRAASGSVDISELFRLAAGATVVLRREGHGAGARVGPPTLGTVEEDVFEAILSLGQLASRRWGASQRPGVASDELAIAVASAALVFSAFLPAGSGGGAAEGHRELLVRWLGSGGSVGLPLQAMFGGVGDPLLHAMLYPPSREEEGMQQGQDGSGWPPRSAQTAPAAHLGLFVALLLPPPSAAAAAAGSPSPANASLPLVSTAQRHAALARLLLLLPRTPTDPSAVPRIKRDLALDEGGTLEDRMQAAAAALQAWQGHTEPAALPHHALLASLHDAREGARSKELRYQGAVVVRPSATTVPPDASSYCPPGEEDAAAAGPPSTAVLVVPTPSFASLAQHLRDFVSTMCRPERLPVVAGSSSSAAVAASHDGGGSDAARRAQQWSQSACHFIDRISRDYAAYADVTTPFLAAAMTLAASVQLSQPLASQPSLGVLEGGQQGALDLTPRSAASARVLAAAASVGQGCLSQASRGDQLAASSRGFRLEFRGVAMRAVYEPLQHPAAPASSSTPPQSLSAYILAASQEALYRDSGAEAAAAAAAKTAGVHTHLDASEEEKKEAAFRADFPDYFRTLRLEDLLPRKLHAFDAAGDSSGARDDAADTGGLEPPGAPPASGAAVDALELASAYVAVLRRDPGLLPCSLAAKSIVGVTDPRDAALHDWLRVWDPVSAAEVEGTQRSGGALDHIVGVSSLLSRLSALLAPPEAAAQGPQLSSAASSSRVTASATTAAPKLGAAARAPITLLPPLGAAVYNFYKDSNAGEASIAVRPLRALGQRILALLALFPGNEMLLQLLKLISGVFHLPLHTPIVGFIAVVSLLLTKAHEWEVIAASYVSLQPHLAAVSSLLTRWRKLELACWRAMLHVAAQESQRAAAELWLRLYGFVHALPADAPAAAGAAPHGSSSPPPPPSRAQEIFGATDRFLRSSTLGQFQCRLALVQCMAAEHEEDAAKGGCTARYCHSSGGGGAVASAPPSCSMGRLLRGIHSYYAAHGPAMTRALEAAAQPVVRDLAGQVTLHKWDDQSLYALQETAEKGHRIVHKALQTFRGVLAAPIGPLLDATGLTRVAPGGGLEEDAPRDAAVAGAMVIREAATAHFNLVPPAPSDLAAAAPPSSASAAAADSPAPSGYAPRIASVCARMRKLLLGGPRALLGPAAIEARVGACAAISESGQELFTQAWELIRQPKAWKTAKRKALVDMLRGCVRNGLQWHVAAVPLPLRELHGALQASEPLAGGSSPLLRLLDSMPTLLASNGKSSSGGVPDLLAAADANFNTVLDCVIRMRSMIASGTAHADLTSNEAKRAAGFADFSVLLLLRQRQVALEHAQLLSGLGAVVEACKTAEAQGAQQALDMSAPPPHHADAVATAHAHAAQLQDHIFALRTARALLHRGRLLLRGVANVLCAPAAAAATAAAIPDTHAANNGPAPPPSAPDIESEGIIVGALAGWDHDAAVTPSLSLLASSDGAAADPLRAAIMAASRTTLHRVEAVTARLAAAEEEASTAHGELAAALTREALGGAAVMRVLTLAPGSQAPLPRESGPLFVPALALHSSAAAAQRALESHRPLCQSLLADIGAMAAGGPDAAGGSGAGNIMLLSYARSVVEQLGTQLLRPAATTASFALPAAMEVEGGLLHQPGGAGVNGPLDAMLQELMLATQGLVPQPAGEVASPAPAGALWGLSLTQQPLLQAALPGAASPDAATAAPSSSPATGSDGAAAPADADEADASSPSAAALMGEFDAARATLQRLRLPRVIAAAWGTLPHSSGPSLDSSSAAAVSALGGAWLALSSGVFADFLRLHAASAEWCARAAVTFLALLRQGLCCPDKPSEGDKDAAGGKDAAGAGPDRPGGEAAEGTGMGAGEGITDVSDQITHEEQVLGLKGEKPPPGPDSGPEGPPPPKPPPNGQEEGLEMEADFEGALEDVAPAGEGDQQPEGEEEEPQGEADMDRAMDSVDNSEPQAEVVDEKLWDGDDEEGDDEEGPGDAPAHGKSAVRGGDSGASDEDMRAKDGEEEPVGDAGPADKDKKEKSKPQKQQQKKKPSRSDAGPPEAPEPDSGGADDAAAAEPEPSPSGGEGEEAGDAQGGSEDDAAAAEGDGGEDEEAPEQLDTVPRAADKSLRDAPEPTAADDDAAGDDDGEGAAPGAEEVAPPPPEEVAGGAGSQGEDEPDPGERAEEEDADMNLDLGGGLKLDGGAEDAASVAASEDPPAAEGEEGPDKVAPTAAEEEGGGDANPPGPPPPPQPPAAPVGGQGGGATGDANTASGGVPGEEQQARTSQGGGGPQPPGLEGAPVEGEAAQPDPQQQQQPAASSVAPKDLAARKPDDGPGGPSAAPPRPPQQPRSSTATQQQKQQPRVRSSRDANPMLDPERALRHWQARVQDDGPPPPPASAIRQHPEAQRAAGAPAEDEQQQPLGAFQQQAMQPSDAQQPQGGSLSSAPDSSTMQLQQQESGGQLGDSSDDITMLLPVDDVANVGASELDLDRIGRAGEEAPGGAPEDGAQPEEEGPGAPAGGGRAAGEGEEDEEMAGEGDSSPASAAAFPPEQEGPPQSEDTPAQGLQRALAGLPAEGSEQPAAAAPGEEEEKGGAAAAAPPSAPAPILVVTQSIAPSSLRPRKQPLLRLNAAADDGEEEELPLESLPPDPEHLRRQLDAMLQELHSTIAGLASLDLASAAWAVLSSITADAAVRLCEGLRLILEPTLAARLGGEFRSGKRINMRRVIPYIASGFRKDKIWMRRSTPSKRTYQVMLAVDDSRSMAPGNTGAGSLACEAVALLAKALSRLEVGEIAIASFGSSVRLLHPFDQPFTDESGARALAQFSFAQETTQTAATMETLVAVMEHARSTASVSAAASTAVGRSTTMQLVFLISDGMLGSGSERERIRNWVTEAAAKGQLVVLVIVDRGGGAASRMGAGGAGATAAATAASDESIVNMQSIRFEGGRVVKSSYLEDYPFPYYIVMQDVHSLPEVLSDALRQWFEIAARPTG